MANTETKTAAETKPVKAKDERVEIYVPRTPGNDDPNELIVINGKNYVLPKGKTSLVPKAVAYEYERKQRAQHRVDNAIVEMVEKTRAQAKAAGIL